MVRVREHDDLADVIADRLNKVAGRAWRPRRTSRSAPTPARPRGGVLPRPGRAAARPARAPAPAELGCARCHRSASTVRPRAQPTQRSRSPGAARVDRRRARAIARRQPVVELALAARPCATSAAAALSSTASRTGPGSPASRRRTTSALYAASPPRRPPAVAGASPSGPGRRTCSSTAPSRDRPHVRRRRAWSARRARRRRGRPAPSTPAPGEHAGHHGAIRGSAQPTACAAGCAGLVSGPRKLKAVATPSSRRGTAACRNAGWKACGEAERDAGLARRPAAHLRRAAGRGGRRAPRARRRARQATTPPGCRA